MNYLILPGTPSPLPEHKSDYGMCERPSPSPKPMSNYGMCLKPSPSPKPMAMSDYSMCQKPSPSPEPMARSDYNMCRKPSPSPEPRSGYGMHLRSSPSPEPKRSQGMRATCPPSTEHKSNFSIRDSGAQEPLFLPYSEDNLEMVVPLLPKLQDFSMRVPLSLTHVGPVPEEGPSQIGAHQPTEAEEPCSSLSKARGKSHIASSYMDLTLDHTAWKWGERAPLPISNEQKGQPSVIGEDD